MYCFSSIMSLLGIKRALNKKVEPSSKLRSSSSSIMDDAGLPSLFLVVHHFCIMQSAYFSIVELNTPKLKLDTSTLKATEKTEVVERQTTIRFLEEPRDRPSSTFLFSSPTSSTEDLYMVVPSNGLKPLAGFKFDFTTESFLPIEPPLPSARNGHVVNLGGRIYFLAHDWYLYSSQHSVFQCYDPVLKSWNSLEPLPKGRFRFGPIVATVVWRGTILFNLDYLHILAYDVIENRWYLVNVEGTGAYDIVGEAVVVGDTVYALTTKSYNLVLELSIHKQRIDGDFVFKLSFRSEIMVRDMKSFNYRTPGEMWGICIRHLVHLGEGNVCLVQSCSGRPSSLHGYQDLQLTYIKLTGKQPEIVADFIHHVKLPPAGNLFEVILCFSLPKCKTPVLREGKIILDRFPDKNESTPVQAEAEKDLKLDDDSSQANIITPPVDCYTDKKQCRESQDPCSSCSGENGFEKHGKVAVMESQGSGLDNDVKEQLDFLKEQAVQLKSNNVMLERSKSSFGAREAIGDPSEAESSVNEVLLDDLTTKVMSPEVDLLRSALESEDQKTAVLEEEGHVSLFESEHEELKIRKQASSDQRKSEETGGVLEEEDQVFESGLKEDLKTQKSVEAAMYDSAVNEIKKLQLELQAMADSEAALTEQDELFKRELNRLRKEMEAQGGAFKRELNSLKRELEVLAPLVGG